MLWKGKNNRGLLHGGVKFASERIYPNRGPKIFPSMTSLRWTNTTLFFSVFFQNTNIQGAGKEGQGGRRVSLDVLPSEKRTHSSYCQGREVRTSPRGREGRWGIVGIPSKLLILLRGLSGPERDPEFRSEMKPLSHAGRDPAEENEKLTWGGVPSTSPH